MSAVNIDSYPKCLLISSTGIPTLVCWPVSIICALVGAVSKIVELVCKLFKAYSETPKKWDERRAAWRDRSHEFLALALVAFFNGIPIFGLSLTKFLEENNIFSGPILAD